MKTPKYIQNYLDSNTSGRILLAKEKHGRRYFRAETREQLFNAALKLVTERGTGKYSIYYNPEDEEILKIKSSMISDDDLQKLPPSYRFEFEYME